MRKADWKKRCKETERRLQNVAKTLDERTRKMNTYWRMLCAIDHLTARCRLTMTKGIEFKF